MLLECSGVRLELYLSGVYVYRFCIGLLGFLPSDQISVEKQRKRQEAEKAETIGSPLPNLGIESKSRIGIGYEAV